MIVVGGFGDSPFLRTELKSLLQPHGISMFNLGQPGWVNSLPCWFMLPEISVLIPLQSKSCGHWRGILDLSPPCGCPRGQRDLRHILPYRSPTVSRDPLEASPSCSYNTTRSATHLRQIRSSDSKGELHRPCVIICHRFSSSILPPDVIAIEPDHSGGRGLSCPILSNLLHTTQKP